MIPTSPNPVRNTNIYKENKISNGTKIAVIGDEDLISGLKIFGFDTFFVKDKVSQTLKEILEKEYSICFIQEIYFPQIRDLFSEIKDQPFPIILPIPDYSQIKGLGKEILKETAIKAVGADILK